MHEKVCRRLCDFLDRLVSTKQNNCAAFPPAQLWNGANADFSCVVATSLVGASATSPRFTLFFFLISFCPSSMCCVEHIADSGRNRGLSSVAAVTGNDKSQNHCQNKSRFWWVRHENLKNFKSRQFGELTPKMTMPKKSVFVRFLVTKIWRLQSLKQSFTSFLTTVRVSKLICNKGHLWCHKGDWPVLQVFFPPSQLYDKLWTCWRQ